MTPYEILEIQPGATTEEIHGAFNRLVRIWNPDRFTGSEQEKAALKFRQLVEAFNTLRDPEQRAPTAGSASERGPRALEKTPGSHDHEPDDWFREAREAQEAGERERAIWLVSNALRENPRKAEYHVLYAGLLIENRGDPHQAIKSLETALKLNPNSADAMIKLAELCQTVSMPARASGLLMKAREISPNHSYFRSKAKRAAVLSASHKAPDSKVKSLLERFLLKLKSILSVVMRQIKPR